MSSHHATLRCETTRWTIADAGSKNGTFVNGQRVLAPRALQEGDIVECGNSFFIYRGNSSGSDHLHTRCKATTLETPPLYYQIAPLFPYVASDISLHLEGETGTGKEVVARAVHQLSRRSGAFVARNCAAIPDNLVESELFGYSKGAFSGAATSHQGQIVAADVGTLFLDEIGELSHSTQAKLLRVLELKEVLPLGASTPIPVDFRLISATLCDLEAAVAAGRFRRDLFGRLGHTLKIPPLRDHKEELGPLIQAFVAAWLTRMLKTGGANLNVYFTLAAARALIRYPWPYNVRELKHCIDGALFAAVAADGHYDRYPVDLNHLPAAVARAHSEPDGAAHPVVARGRSELSDAKVLETLGATNGSRSEAARRLGVSERTVFRRLRRLKDEQVDTGGGEPIRDAADEKIDERAAEGDNADIPSSEP